MSLVLDRDPVLTSTPGHGGVRTRALTRSDAAALDEIFSGLSARSRYLRYHSGTPRLTARMRQALLEVDGRRHLARVAEVAVPGGVRAIGIARAVGIGARRAELALEVVDAWHRQGVGSLLLTEVAVEARRVGYAELYAEVLPENRAMRRLLDRTLGAGLLEQDDGGTRIRYGAPVTSS
jgi:GNAT superfamily N-acetyltransferase